MVTNMEGRSGTGSNLHKVNKFWDLFPWYRKGFSEERNKAFWDTAEIILQNSGEVGLLKTIRKLRKNCYIPSEGDGVGSFAIRVNGKLLFTEKTLNYLDRDPDTKAEGTHTCMLSGERCSPILVHPEITINGFDNQTSPMISFNKDVFMYGNLKQGYNYPWYAQRCPQGGAEQYPGAIQKGCPGCYQQNENKPL